jgi:short-subunit dehydrogenase
LLRGVRTSLAANEQENERRKMMLYDIGLSEARVVLVTGASFGIGKATATLLSEEGFRVFGTSRRPSGAQGNGFQMLPLDVTSDQSVATCASSVIEQAGRIDVLVNNAGIGLLGALEETSLAEARAVFETNFFGMVRMVNSVLPGMRRRKHGLIINLGSLAATLPIPFHGYLTASKAAVNAYTDALRLEVRPLGIQVALVEPGFVRTHLDEQWAGLRVPRSIQDYAAVEQNVLVKLEAASRMSAEPQVVAKSILRILQSPSPAPHYLGGKEQWYLLLNRIVPASAMEFLIRKRLGLAR